MSKTKIIVAVGVGVGIVIAAGFVQTFGSEGAIFERFPGVPREIAKKVHREMLRESLMGKYDLPNNTAELNAAYDTIFMEKVQKYTNQ